MLDKIYSFTTGILTAATIVMTFSFFLFYIYELRYQRQRLSRAARKAAAEAAETGAELPSPQKKRLSFQFQRHPMEKKDRLPVLVITAVYLAIALINLGSFSDPQTFTHFTTEDYQVVLELEEETEISNIWYYAGLYSGSSFEVSYSSDGESWVVLDDVFQRYNTLFKWHDMEEEMTDEDTITHTPYGSFPFTARYVRLTLIDGTDLALGEIVLYDGNGERIAAEQIATSELGLTLIDEPDEVPDTISFMNSTYFDEVYHARTAYEHLNNVYPYEDSHPPLGKLLMSVGIMIFGMTAFGWRIVGTLFGAAMLPILYVFLKNLFGKTPLATCGTLLFAFDFMHFAQTRIATIDTYSVFFVLLAFYFLYRYFTVAEGAPFWKEMVPLGLCGLFFGIGAACKWTVIYAGVGLCVLYFWRIILRWKRHHKESGFYKWMVATLLWSVVFFILIPGVIYTACYIPYAMASGNSVLYEMVENQKFMFTYHNGVHQDHPYASRWWQWILDIRPILYYVQYNADATKACIGAFGNPLIVWTGLLAEVGLLVCAVRKRSGVALFLFIAWVAELFPWMIIGRTTFEYHYFGCILFLVFAIVYFMNEMWELTRGKCRRYLYGFTGYGLGLFALFYPALSGLTVPRWYCYAFLKWFDSWPWG
ncbi:MAG: phospholipid carrier-dependent glycosyltransferase [Oscillospiraceae bacterium]|nr:phospholipid carrier-dependent glycosyltransferase [Oscillospiraceae bacterium]